MPMARASIKALRSRAEHHYIGIAVFLLIITWSARVTALQNTLRDSQNRRLVTLTAAVLYWIFI